jgi:hypothetical protein
VLLLLPHANPVAKLSLPQGPLQRDAFDVRQFVEEHALRTDGGGAFMWRAVWDEESSRIWREVISEDPSHLIGEVHVRADLLCRKTGATVWIPPQAGPVRGFEEREEVRVMIMCRAFGLDYGTWVIIESIYSRRTQLSEGILVPHWSG